MGFKEAESEVTSKTRKEKLDSRSLSRGEECLSFLPSISVIKY